MLKTRDFWFPVAIGGLVLILVSIPYVLAARAAGADFVFGGFLINPYDGNTYLAKMYQGGLGEWRFRLPYTANPGEGAYLNLFYLALGHLGRIGNLPNIVVYHLVRLLGAALLLWTLWRYFGALFSRTRPHKIAFALASLGSGMGWLLVMAGVFTSDFWVAEAYPFLSALTNPHFPISLVLMLWLLMPPLDRALRARERALIGAGALALSIISPFGAAVVLMVLGADFLWRLLQRVWSWNLFWRIFCVALCGLPVMIYDLWAVAVDPILAGWNVQNLTPSPALGDWVVSFLPALLLACVGAWGVMRWRKQKKALEAGAPSDWVPLALWVFFGLILMYLPWGLQRRFVIGFFIPLAGLAAIGLETIAIGYPHRYRSLVFVVFFLAVPTNLIILLAGFQATRTHDPQIYLTREEASALLWIEENADPDALILSSPEMGLFIPAYTGRQVIYGHPFETVDAEIWETAVTKFFSGQWTKAELQVFVTKMGVDYIFFGPRERTLGAIEPLSSWQAVFQTPNISIYEPGKP